MENNSDQHQLYLRRAIFGPLRAVRAAVAAPCLAVFLLLGLGPETAAHTAIPEGSEAGAASIEWYKVDPPVVPDSMASPVTFTWKINGTYDAIRLDLEAGGSVFPVDIGGGVWTVSLNATDVLFGYTPSDVNRNLVGFLTVLQGATELFRLNQLVNVTDSTIPSEPSTPLASDVIHTSHAVNIHEPDLTFPPRPHRCGP